MAELAGFFLSLAEKGGPEPGEYDSLNSCFHDLAPKVRSGTIPAGALLQLWRDLGEAFSSTRTLQGHVVARPYGYCGDFELMDKIYTRWISCDPKFANWDRFFHSQEATQAVRRRERYCVSLVQRLLAAGPDPTTFRVLNVGCGPAREVHDLCGTPNADRIYFDCVDLDPRAIVYAQRLNHSHSRQARFICGNVLRFRTNERYDLIWGSGIFDYFDDRIFSSVLRRLLPLVRPGGRLVVSNFSPNNPTRDYMECGQWLIWHRAVDQILRIAVNAGVSGDHVTMEEDPEGVISYLQIRLPA